MPRALVRVLVVLACALALGGGTCGGDGVSPQLSGLTYVGQAPDSTAVILLEVDFEDPTGDLGEGYLETFIGGRASGLGALLLQPIFLDSGVPLDATTGTLELVVELAFGRDESQWPADGAEFDLGLRAVDLAGNASNLEEVKLRIDYP